MQGKGVNFATRIPAGRRAALEAAAERTGRSMSEIADAWLAFGEAQDALVPASPEIMREIALMTRFAAAVVKREGDPMRSLIAREMLCLGWEVIARKALGDFTDSARRYDNAAAYIAQQVLDMTSPSLLEDPSMGEDRGGLRGILEGIVAHRLVSSDPHWPQEAARLKQMFDALTTKNRAVIMSLREDDAASIDRAGDDEEALVRLLALTDLMRFASKAPDAHDVRAERIGRRASLLLAEVGVIARDDVPGFGDLLARLSHEKLLAAQDEAERAKAETAARKHGDEPPDAA
jgi:hypothetical protein